MSETGRSVECGNCHQVLDEPTNLHPLERKPCPSCGSLTRHVRLSFKEKLTLHSKLKMKARPPGGGRPTYETVTGDDLHHKTGRWMKIRRIIDRANNLYEEIITDPETGQIMHRCKEPLSHHKGHGSAKQRKSDQQNDDV